MVPWEEWHPSMLRWEPPPGPYVTRNSAHYPGDMNRLLADEWVKAGVKQKIPQTQARSMVLAGKWQNTLVAQHMCSTPPHNQVSRHTLAGRPCVKGSRIGGPPTVDMPSPIFSHRNVWLREEPGHSPGNYVTGMPRVTQPVPLRPRPEVDRGPLFDPKLCVGGLVDTWKSVKRVPGHIEQGQRVSAVMDRYFDANASIERKDSGIGRFGQRQTSGTCRTR